MNWEAAAIQLRLQVYEGVPPRPWHKVAPGAQRTWIQHAHTVVEAALDNEPHYRKMTDDELAALPLPHVNLTEQDCFIQVWPEDDS